MRRFLDNYENEIGVFLVAANLVFGNYVLAVVLAAIVYLTWD